MAKPTAQMAPLSEAYIVASERLAGRRGEVEKTREHVRKGTVRLLDAEDRIKKRIERLMQNPLIARELREKGVDELLSKPLNELSPEAESELERVINGADFLPVWFLIRGAELRRTVGRVLARTQSGVEAPATGFLVGPGVLLTNYHVLDWTDVGKQPLDEIAPSSIVEFDFEEQVDDQLAAPVARFRLQPSKLLLASPWHQLDYILIAVEPRSMGGGAIAVEDLGHNRLTGDQGKVSKGEPVFIMQHPGGQPKKVVLQNNRLIDREDNGPYLTYEADTQGGSSGSPVFNRQWEVVALHHATQIARDGSGKILARNGDLWQPSMGSGSIKYLDLNEGIRVSWILEDMARKCQLLEQGEASGLEAYEACSPEGLALLKATLQFRRGGTPKEINAPVAPAVMARSLRPAAPGSPGRGRFPRPD